MDVYRMLQIKEMKTIGLTGTFYVHLKYTFVLPKSNICIDLIEDNLY